MRTDWKVWMPLAMAVLVVVSGCQRRSLTGEEEADIDAWLHCVECTDGELERIVTTVGGESLVRDDLHATLRLALREPLSEELDVLEENYGAEWARMPGSAVDSAEFVRFFVDNYRATMQKRAAIAMGAVGDTTGLREALQSTAFAGYRPDVQAAIEQAFAAAGGPPPPGYTPPVPTRVVLLPETVTLATGDTTVLEALVLDANGSPMAVPLTWGSDNTGAATVDELEPGYAELAGIDDGSARITVTTGSLADTTPVAVVTAPTSPPPVFIGIVGGDAQADTAGTPLDEPLVVRVTAGSGGAPIAGATVTWQVTRGDATPATASSVTDGSGRAFLNLMLGPTPTRIWVAARVGSVGVMFRLRSRSP